MGEDAFLRATVQCKVNVEYGVQVTEDDLIYVRDVMTISNSVQPVRGDTVEFDTSTGTRRVYVLDRKLQDNGVNSRFIALEQ